MKWLLVQFLQTRKLGIKDEDITIVGLDALPMR